MPTYNAAYTVSLSAQSQAKLAALASAAPLAMRTALTTGMWACVQQVKARAVQNAPWVSGNLRRNIIADVQEIPEVIGIVGVGNNVPYARRREFGFDDQRDSLNRYFPQDPKDPAKRANMFYMRRALDDSRPFIATTLWGSVDVALRVLSRTP